MQKKALSFALAAVFMFAAFGGLFLSAEDSDATAAGSMNIHIINGNDSDSYYNVSGYNALQALMSISGVTVVADDDYIIKLHNNYGYYDDINLNYGNLTSINNVPNTSTDVWNIFIYQSDWIISPVSLGFIQPFAGAACASADIVLYYGEEATDVPDEIYDIEAEDNLIVPSGSNYRYTFELKIQAGAGTPTIATGTTVTYVSNGIESTKTLDSSDLSNGIIVVGYGSNAYAALKDAIGYANVSGTEAAGAYNGWINTIFGLGTVPGNNYTYWATYFADNSYTPFVLGAYSSLSNVPTGPILGSSTDYYDMTQTAFKLTYELYVYS